MPDPQTEALENILGKITVRWNDLHYHVYQLFEGLLLNQSDVAHAIYFALDSDRAQRNITSDLARVLLKKDRNLLTGVTTALEDIGKLSGKRNDLIHAIWPNVISDNPKPALPRKGRLSGVKVMATARDLLDQIDDIDQQIASLFYIVRLQVWAEDRRKKMAPILDKISPTLRPRHLRGSKKAKTRGNGRKGNPQ